MYVDDFKLSGPTANLKKGWELIRSKIKTEDPTPLGRYLGCDHKVVSKIINPGEDPILTAGVKPKPSTGHKVKAMIYDVSTFLESCVDKYCESVKCSKSK